MVEDLIQIAALANLSFVLGNTLDRDHQRPLGSGR
jgi:hypothetical protein